MNTKTKYMILPVLALAVMIPAMSMAGAQNDEL